MSEEEAQLLELWKADAREYRRRVHSYDLEEDGGDIGSAAIFVRTKPGQTKKCEQCREPFVGLPFKKYCSEACRRQGNHARDQLRDKAQRVAAGLRTHRVRGHWRTFERADSPALSSDGVYRCTVCGNPYSPSIYRGGGPPKKFCSNRCAKAAWRTRRAEG